MIIGPLLCFCLAPDFLGLPFFQEIARIRHFAPGQLHQAMHSIGVAHIAPITTTVVYHRDIVSVSACIQCRRVDADIRQRPADIQLCNESPAQQLQQLLTGRKCAVVGLCEGEVLSSVHRLLNFGWWLGALAIRPDALGFIGAGGDA
jgi:hypothetical protein